MTFDYSGYFRSDFLVPLSIVIFTLFILLMESMVFIRDIRKKKCSSTEATGNRTVLTHFCTMAVSVTCLVAQIISLSNGGIYLIQEKVDDSVVTMGIVEEIEQLNGFIYHKHRVNKELKYGVHITISGIEYTAMSSENLQEGDNIVFEYLPKSRFILMIEKQE